MKNLFSKLTQKEDQRKIIFGSFADKQGEKVKTWQNRYFAFYDNGDLEYYQGVKPAINQNEIDLKKGSLKGKISLNDAKFSLEYKTVKGFDYVVNIFIGERHYMISVPGMDSLTEWRKALLSLKCNMIGDNSSKVVWGFAEKLGEKYKTWNSRYFVLSEDGSLEYYKVNLKGSLMMTDQILDLTKLELKGKVNVNGIKFKCPNGIKDHEHVISLELSERDFLISFLDQKTLDNFRMSMIKVGASFYDPQMKNKAPVNEIALELKKLQGLSTSFRVEKSSKDVQPLIWENVSKLGEKIKNWTERYFVLYSNGELEYYKGIKACEKEMADLSTGDLKGKVNINGSRFKPNKDLDNSIIIELYGRDLSILFKNYESLKNWQDKLIEAGCEIYDQNVKVVKWGFLEKQGEKNLKWQTRYFVLYSNGDMEYYNGVKDNKTSELQDYKKAELKGKISLYGCRFKLMKEGEGREFIFQLELKTGRNFFISLPKKDTMLEWREKIHGVGCGYYDPDIANELEDSMFSDWKFFGFAQKQGEKVKNWQQRYFVLKMNSSLEYYHLNQNIIPKDPKKPINICNEKLKGKIELKGSSFQIINNIKDHPNVLQIELKTGRNFLISLKDNETLMAWKKNLSESGSNYYYLM